MTMTHADFCVTAPQDHSGPCFSKDDTELLSLPDMVDHPSHYGGKDDPYEVIKVLEAWMTPEQMSGFCLGNTIKYVGRAGKKGDLVEDLKKARWYLDLAISKMEKRTSA